MIYYLDLSYNQIPLPKCNFQEQKCVIASNIFYKCKITLEASILPSSEPLL